MKTGNHANPNQIPTEFNEEQTTRAIRKQDRVPGEQREKTIADFSKTADVGLVLKDLQFPADKSEIVEFVEKSSLPQSKEIFNDIARMENKTYYNAFEVAEAAKLVQ